MAKRKARANSKRIRSTEDVWVVQGYYGKNTGWEPVYTGETYRDARARLAEYRANEPQYPHRLVMRREKKQAQSNPSPKANDFIPASAVRIRKRKDGGVDIDIKRPSLPNFLADIKKRRKQLRERKEERAKKGKRNPTPPLKRKGFRRLFDAMRGEVGYSTLPKGKMGRGGSYGPLHSAKEHAEALSWADKKGYIFRWDWDDITNRFFTDEGEEYQLFVCALYDPATDEIIDSLGGIDLGPEAAQYQKPSKRFGTRVYEAEVALSAMPSYAKKGTRSRKANAGAKAPKIGSYEEARALLGNQYKKKIGHNTFLVSGGSGLVAVRLHETNIILFHSDGRIVLNTGGWQTVTTKARINEILKNTPYRIWSEKGNWYITGPKGMKEPYRDGITLYPAQGIYETGGWGGEPKKFKGYNFNPGMGRKVRPTGTTYYSTSKRTFKSLPVGAIFKFATRINAGGPYVKLGSRTYAPVDNRKDIIKIGSINNTVVLPGEDQTDLITGMGYHFKKNPGKGRGKLTVAQAKALVKPLGFTLKKDSAGDYVLQGRGQKYFTPYLDDAVGTAKAIAKA